MRSPDTRRHTSRSALRLLVVLICFLTVLIAMTAPAEAVRRVGHPSRVYVTHVTTSSATLRWSAPRKARSFRVQYSTSRRMKHAHYKRFYARTGRVCPGRCVRSIACASTAGFHHGSSRYT